MKNAFQKGSGCYTCSACGRKTRDTSGDAVNCGLCDECFELSGIDNSILDGISTYKNEKETIEALQKSLTDKGGKVWKLECQFNS
jgi:hypothetical protein